MPRISQPVASDDNHPLSKVSKHCATHLDVELHSVEAFPVGSLIFRIRRILVLDQHTGPSRACGVLVNTK